MDITHDGIIYGTILGLMFVFGFRFADIFDIVIDSIGDKFITFHNLPKSIDKNKVYTRYILPCYDITCIQKLFDYARSIDR